MKRFICLIWGIVIFQSVYSQVDLKMLMRLLNLNQSKLENHLQKKGYKRAGAFVPDDAFAKVKKEKSGTIVRSFQIAEKEGGYDLIYKTTSQQEYAELEKELLSSGFYNSAAKTNNAGSLYYQKKDLVLSCYSEPADSTLLYVVRANKKTIPKLKEIVFAEDLLQLDSHEYLSEAFGKQNVKKDLFPLSPTVSKPCTIIFPNTSRQAIFLWNDEENLRDISCIIIGEQLNADKDVNAVRLSNWRSSQGVYCGMSLREMESLNREPVSFYNWRTEAAGFLAPQNKGAIDFTKIKPVFNCMNCNFLYVDAAVDIIQSNYSINENQKVYVGSFAILPEKKMEIRGQTSLK